MILMHSFRKGFKHLRYVVLIIAGLLFALFAPSKTVPNSHAGNNVTEVGSGLWGTAYADAPACDSCEADFCGTAGCGSPNVDENGNPTNGSASGSGEGDSSCGGADGDGCGD